MNNNLQPPATVRIIPVVFGAIFAAIGVTVIVFLWSSGGPGEPPVFFRIFGSLIVLAFVVVGGATAIVALTGGRSRRKADSDHPMPSNVTTYTCPRCGAPLAKDADVSPLGDVRCGHCSGWFNIHRTSSPE